MQGVVRPAAESVGLLVRTPYDFLGGGGRIVDQLDLATRGANIVVADITRLDVSVAFQLGIARAADRRLVLLSERLDIPLDIYGAHEVLIYGSRPTDWERIEQRLRRVFSYLLESPRLVAAPADRFRRDSVAVTVEIFSETPEVDVLALGAELSENLAHAAGAEHAQVVDANLGSIGLGFELSPEALRRLIRKLYVWIPEWQVKQGEATKLNAEAVKILAEAEAITSDTELDRGERILTLLERARDIGGIRVTVGETVQIEAAPGDALEARDPERLLLPPPDSDPDDLG